VDPEQPAELGDGLGVVVDAQVGDPVDAFPALVARADPLDDDRG
jgi:hypothetical protein